MILYSTKKFGRWEAEFKKTIRTKEIITGMGQLEITHQELKTNVSFPGHKT